MQSSIANRLFTTKTSGMNGIIKSLVSLSATIGTPDSDSDSDPVPDPDPNLKP
jgi:hypothetical protein